jgi:chemotaxis protein MotB
MIQGHSAENQHVRRSLGEVETDAEGSWAISYGDMITLLLTFFILYFNINNKHEEQRNLIQKEILLEFAEKKTPVEPETLNAPPRMKLGEAQKGELDAAVLQNWGGNVIRDGEKIIIQFPLVPFFDLGREDVLAGSKKHLEIFAKKYVKFAGTHMLNVKAFTDTVTVRTGHRYRDNLELSALRAISAMRVLQASGIPLSRMKIVGLGETITNRIPGGLNAESDPAHKNEKGDRFARKVVLVIEPVTREKL